MELGLSAEDRELKALAAETTRALAVLDATRLETLAAYCEALMRKLGPELIDRDWRKDLPRQAREAQGDMAVLGRVLEATRANVSVMKRLSEMRLGQLEYSARSAEAIAAGPAGTGSQAENGDGNH